MLKQLQPNIRTVAKQLLNPAEQALLRTTVSLMTAYRFAFNMGKYGQEGEPEELLQPPIHILCSFQVIFDEFRAVAGNGREQYHRST